MSSEEELNPRDIVDYSSDEQLIEDLSEEAEDSQKKVDQNGLLRLVTMGGAVASMLIVVGSILFLFNKSSPPKVADNLSPMEKSAEEETEESKLEAENQQLRTERDQMKAQQALQEQSEILTTDLGEEKIDSNSSEKTPSVKKENSETTQSQLASSELESPTSSPSSPPSSESSPLPPPSPESSLPPPSPKSITDPVDPFERWQALANSGQERGSFYEEPEETEAVEGEEPKIQESEEIEVIDEEEPKIEKPEDTSGGIKKTIILNKEKPTATKPRVGSSQGESQILQMSVQFPSSRLVSTGSSSHLAQTSLGETGILNQSSPPPQEEVRDPIELQIGSSVEGVVVVPMVWSPTAGTPTYGRYLVELTEPMQSTNGDVVFEEGTLFVTEVEDFAETLGIRQSVVAVVYEDQSGQIQQEEIESGTFLVRGEDNLPLISEGLFDPGGEIAKQDGLISTLSALGRIGEVLNEPDEEVTIDTGSDGRIVTTERTRRDDKNLFGAALQGFFQPLSETLRERSQQQIQEQLNRPQVYVIEKGTPVSVYINRFVEVGQ